MNFGLIRVKQNIFNGNLRLQNVVTQGPLKTSIHRQVGSNERICVGHFYSHQHAQRTELQNLWVVSLPEIKRPKLIAIPHFTGWWTTAYNVPQISLYKHQGVVLGHRGNEYPSTFYIDDGEEMKPAKCMRNSVFLWSEHQGHSTLRKVNRFHVPKILK
jgi:hypothetical protein